MCRTGHGNNQQTCETVCKNIMTHMVPQSAQWPLRPDEKATTVMRRRKSQARHILLERTQPLQYRQASQAVRPARKIRRRPPGKPPRLHRRAYRAARPASRQARTLCPLRLRNQIAQRTLERPPQNLPSERRKFVSLHRGWQAGRNWTRQNPPACLEPRAIDGQSKDALLMVRVWTEIEDSGLTTSTLRKDDQRITVTAIKLTTACTATVRQMMAWSRCRDDAQTAPSKRLDYPGHRAQILSETRAPEIAGMTGTTGAPPAALPLLVPRYRISYRRRPCLQRPKVACSAIRNL